MLVTAFTAHRIVDQQLSSRRDNSADNMSLVNVSRDRRSTVEIRRHHTRYECREAHTV